MICVTQNIQIRARNEGIVAIKAGAKVTLVVTRGVDDPPGRTPCQRILAPVPWGVLQCHEIWYYNSIFRDCRLLVAGSDAARLLARILWYTGQWVVESQSLKLG